MLHTTNGLIYSSLGSIIMDELGSHFPPQFEDSRPGDVKDSLADITAAQNAFGYSPDYTVLKGLQETIAWYEKTSPN